MGTEYIMLVVFVLHQLLGGDLKRGLGRCKIKEAGIFSWKEISCLSNMCTKYINNHKLSIHINFIGTGTRTHTHTHTFAQGCRVCPASARVLRVPALFLPVPLLVPAQSGHPITSAEASLCIDLQIICSFTITPHHHHHHHYPYFCQHFHSVILQNSEECHVVNVNYLPAYTPYCYI